MKKAIQVTVLVVSMLVALHIFGSDGYDYSFTQLYVGFAALAVSFADIVTLYGAGEEN